MQQKTDLEQRQKMSEEWENGKAAELALKEVLGSVREARYAVSPTCCGYSIDGYR
jgi:hypothetical protein